MKPNEGSAEDVVQIAKADVMKANLHDPFGMTDDLKRMVLNPDVTVRAKGVIEKCSFCSQRIQEKKMKANKILGVCRLGWSG